MVGLRNIDIICFNARYDGVFKSISLYFTVLMDFLICLAYKGTEQVAAQTIIMQVASFAYMVPLGLSIATASLVGNLLGANKRPVAILIGQMSLKVVFVLQCIVGTVLYFGGPAFIGTFTSDNAVREETERMLPFLAIFTIFDGIQVDDTYRRTG